MRKASVRAFIIVLLIARAVDAVAQEATWKHLPGQSVSLRLGDAMIWESRFPPDGGFPYFHPVATPSGRILTDLAPKDHPWHRAVWFSWKYLDGVNYWDWGGRKGGIPDGLTKVVGPEVVKTDARGASMTFRLEYRHGGKCVLKERREVAVGLPRADGSYAMDWRMTFTGAGDDVVFERTPPKQKPWGGYGGLSYRAAAGLRNHRVLNSEARLNKDGHGKPARWMDFSGAFADGTAAGVALFDHPDNPRHPTPWYLSTGKMGYINAALLFHEPYTLPGGKTLTLRYRILIHPGRGDAIVLDREFEAFRALK